MKLSTFEKQLFATGPNGKFEATILVTMNYSTMTVTGTNPSTHDDYTATRPIHKVQVLINGAVWKDADRIREEKDVIILTEKLLNEAFDHLKFLATEPPQKSFDQKITELFNQYTQF